ncbi:O-methyltransferase [Sciscionella sediminilitoris]|uniref:O-methyltransferase n=1 Tax=Sciscionella sediminilitoris TaxID=1445613 RepID=UPI0004DFC5B9
MTADPVKAHDSGIETYVHDYFAEDDTLASARERGVDAGADPVSPATGAALRFLTATARARAVVEVGTGSGVSGLYLLAGMAEGGVLTTIDVEPEHQRTARRAFTEAGYPAGRARLIMGRGLDVLPRLTDAGYDLVFVDAARIEYPRYYEQAVRLLREGGVIAFDGVFANGRVGDRSRRDAETAALRELAALVRADERLAPAFVPLADGLLLAAKTATG